MRRVRWIQSSPDGATRATVWQSRIGRDRRSRPIRTRSHLQVDDAGALELGAITDQASRPPRRDARSGGSKLSRPRLAVCAKLFSPATACRISLAGKRSSSTTAAGLPQRRPVERFELEIRDFTDLPDLMVLRAAPPQTPGCSAQTATTPGSELARPRGRERRFRRADINQPVADAPHIDHVVRAVSGELSPKP
jgi:hypothetical protein